jgi:hypothetical protein
MISVDKITNTANTITVPILELYNNRYLQRYQSVYTGGSWNPNNSYQWVPGSFVDFTPQRSDSLIQYAWRAPHAWVNASHGIVHLQFYANGRLFKYHSLSGTHLEDGDTYMWEVPSWGTFNARIGCQVRSYAVNNHTLRFYDTNYWNGTGSRQNSYGQLMVDEVLGSGEVA